MAKELPYFKFTVAEWLTGDIVYEPLNVQGLFINICAIYWQREGRLSVEDIIKRFKNPSELTQLINRFFSVSDGFISINFLDEQFTERKSLSFRNSKNGKKGGIAKALLTKGLVANAKRTLGEGVAKRGNIEKNKKRKEKNIGNKIPFSLATIFDRHKFKEEFPSWSKEKLKHYYEAADRYSTEGNKYIDWKKAIAGWAAKDELEGKFKFHSAVTGTNKTETLVERQARLTAENHV